MSHREILHAVGDVLGQTGDDDAARLLALLDTAPRVFVCGVGRSALVARFFGMRLMHAGYAAWVVGEIVTPPIAAGDLLVVVSGSGATETLQPVARKARELGARVVLVTMREASPIAALADAVVLLGREGSAQPRPGMPMGTVFELSALVLLESVVALIVGNKSLAESELRARHANLE